MFMHRQIDALTRLAFVLAVDLNAAEEVGTPDEGFIQLGVMNEVIMNDVDWTILFFAAVVVTCSPILLV